MYPLCRAGGKYSAQSVFVVYSDSSRYMKYRGQNTRDHEGVKARMYRSDCYGHSKDSHNHPSVRFLDSNTFSLGRAVVLYKQSLNIEFAFADILAI